MIKKLIFKTNENNKLNGRYFLHISVALPFFSDVKIIGNEYLVTVEDKSVTDFHAKLIEYARYHLGFLPMICTLTGHGMYPEQFKEFYMKNNPTASLNSLVAIYLYEKLPEGHLFNNEA